MRDLKYTFRNHFEGAEYLTCFPFINYCNTNHWSESLVKKLVLGELSAESALYWCSEIKRSLPWGWGGDCTGDAWTGTRQHWWQYKEYNENLMNQGWAATQSSTAGTWTQDPARISYTGQDSLCLPLPQALPPVGTWHSCIQNCSAHGPLRSQMIPRLGVRKEKPN